MKIKELTQFDFPDTKQEPDGYDWKTVPDISARNIEVITNKLNEVINVVNQILDVTILVKRGKDDAV